MYLLENTVVLAYSISDKSNQRYPFFAKSVIYKITRVSPNTVKSPAMYLSDRYMTIRRLENSLGRVQRLPSMPYPSA